MELEVKKLSEQLASELRSKGFTHFLLKKGVWIDDVQGTVEMLPINYDPGKEGIPPGFDGYDCNEPGDIAKNLSNNEGITFVLIEYAHLSVSN